MSDIQGPWRDINLKVRTIGDVDPRSLLLLVGMILVPHLWMVVPSVAGIWALWILEKRRMPPEMGYRWLLSWLSGDRKLPGAQR